MSGRSSSGGGKAAAAGTGAGAPSSAGCGASLSAAAAATGRFPASASSAPALDPPPAAVSSRRRPAKHSGRLSIQSAHKAVLAVTTFKCPWTFGLQAVCQLIIIAKRPNLAGLERMYKRLAQCVHVALFGATSALRTWHYGFCSRARRRIRDCIILLRHARRVHCDRRPRYRLPTNPLRSV